MQSSVISNANQDDLPPLNCVVKFISIKPSIGDHIRLYICEPCPVRVEIEISSEYYQPNDYSFLE